MAELLKELTSLTAQFNPGQLEQELAMKRSLACELAIRDVFQNFKEQLKESARRGAKQAKLVEWSFSENRIYNGCYLLDLLNKGELLTRMQRFLDTSYGGENGERLYKVFYSSISNSAHVSAHGRKDLRFAVYVSWDQPSFSLIDERLAKLRDYLSRKRSSKDSSPTGSPTGSPTESPATSPPGSPRAQYQAGIREFTIADSKTASADRRQPSIIQVIQLKRPD